MPLSTRERHQLDFIAADTMERVAAEAHTIESAIAQNPEAFDTTSCENELARALVVAAVNESRQEVGMSRATAAGAFELAGDLNDDQAEHRFRVLRGQRNKDGQLRVIANASTGLVPSRDLSTAPRMFGHTDHWILVYIWGEDGIIDEMLAAHVDGKEGGNPGYYLFDEIHGLGGDGLPPGAFCPPDEDLDLGDGEEDRGDGHVAGAS